MYPKYALILMKFTNDTILTSPYINVQSCSETRRHSISSTLSLQRLQEAVISHLPKGQQSCHHQLDDFQRTCAREACGRHHHIDWPQTQHKNDANEHRINSFIFYFIPLQWQGWCSPVAIRMRTCALSMGPSHPVFVNKINRRGEFSFT